MSNSIGNLNEQKTIRLQEVCEPQGKDEDPYLTVKYDQMHHSSDIIDHFDAFENSEVRIAGRVMNKRSMGKSAFYNVLDQKGSWENEKLILSN